ncbi:hypothetical protein COO60DRAFT_484789 [Scenedesmus sp. NREL 46B-D3]|nr:hypothetical protein COO60DRAFT_484789 [Scenedesmus sp. NREL 46B-D3]
MVFLSALLQELATGRLRMMRECTDWLPAALAFCMLLLLAGPRMTGGQGLFLTPEQLGASAADTATEFETFEDLLALSTTGMGRTI